MVIVDTPRLILRHLRLDDAVAVNPVFGDPEVMRFGDGVRDPEWVTLWIAKWLNEYYPRWQFGAWAMVDKGSTSVTVSTAGCLRSVQVTSASLIESAPRTMAADGLRRQ